MSKSALSRLYLHNEKATCAFIESQLWAGGAKPSKKDNFIAAARAHGADESGETFLCTFKAIAKPKNKK
jgi:hypothetical protein